ncbi:MAG: FAD-dependent monooxygenase [Pseudonocardiaceae bacterium]
MKAVICGAGIAGLALAERLDTLGWDIVVLEQAHAPRAHGYMIDFFGPGYDVVEAMGALSRLHELGYHIHEMSYLNEAGRQRASLNSAKFAKVTGCGREVSIMRPDLERVLREQLSADVDLRFATSLTHVDASTDGVHLTLTDGSTLDADLLVGADGTHSTVRTLVYGEERRYFRYLGLHAAAFIVDDPGIHAELRGRFCVTDTINREMSFCGLRDGRVVVSAVHRTPDPVLPVDAQTAVRRAYGSLGWIVPRALAQCPPAAEMHYDQVAQIDMPQWSRGRVTLVGDACQAVSLISGQGASVGIAGAHVLAEQLTQTDSIETALDRYERLWRPVIAEKQRVARQHVRWFLPESQLRLRTRRAIMKLASLPGFDRYIYGRLIGESTAVVEKQNATRPGSMRS